jgi:cobalamin synthase
MFRATVAGFFQSLSQITWLPLPAFARSQGVPCVGALPLIGALLGLVAAVLYMLLLTVLPASLAMVLSLAGVMLLTGATAEVMWAQQGPRAAVALAGVCLLRLVALLELSEEVVPMALLVAQPLAQLAGVAALFALPVPLGPHQPVLTQSFHPAAISHRGRVVAVAFGVVPLVLLTAEELVAVASVVLVAISVTLLLLRARRTPPLAGFFITAQVVEVAVYVALNLAWETLPAEGLML